MPAKLYSLCLGVVLAAAGLSGCTSTSATHTAPSLAAAGSEAGADAGPTLELPQTVAVLPEAADPSIQIAALPAGAMAANAFAGSTPGVPALAASDAGAPVVPLAAIAAAAAPSAGEGVATLQPAVYVEPAGPAGPADRGEIDKLISKYAVLYEVPEDLVRRVVNRESTFNPRAYNRGHWGLMQIKHATARGMGYLGPARGLFDAETNLKYAVKYLRGAWLVSGGNADRADRLYQRGYYYDAKRKGLLEETGLGGDGRRHRLPQPEPMPAAILPPPAKPEPAA
ncbi:transglycosylase SLT domain-containing protein [Mesorhizobium sp. SP-1A]|uniref:transglycosylase SLT domain-containing protein n=1 Tax=Mesorhizobium sp. SP-1A TaxID=3077840 RepID=UPI0039655F6D